MFEDKKNFKNAPLYEKLRPKNFKEFFGQYHIVNNNSIIDLMIEKKEIFSMIFWGPSGVGKTTLAKLIANEFNYKFIQFSAVVNSSLDVKDVILDMYKKKMYHEKILIFIDEIHRFNSKQQDLFLPFLEEGYIVLIGATTENPSFSLNNALISRCRIIEMHPLLRDDLLLLYGRVKLYFGDSFDLKKSVVEYLIEVSGGDARYFLNMIENILMIPNYKELEIAEMQKYLTKKISLHDKNKDGHYNLISALHKSIRGSDEQASLYWFYRMIDVDEDVNYILRRLARIATEDIGLADMNASLFVMNAWEIYKKLGDGEGILEIAKVIVYLALAPKSNSIYLAEKKIKKKVLETKNVMPPKSILNAPTEMMENLGYGAGYKYDHDFENSFSGMNFFPDKMKRESFYVPKNIGFERELKKRVEYFNKLRKYLKEVGGD
jgi:putative ATPase